MPTPSEEIEEIMVDSYGEYEQMCSWEVTFTDAVRLPFQAALLDIPVEVTGFRVSDAPAVQCQIVHAGKSRWIGVEGLDEKGLPDEMHRLVTLYQAWLEGDY